MKTVGIIAEYNPFHNGHAYQIDSLKKQGAEQIVVVMSGDFVQRGMPAFCDKYKRTQMALEYGADFVFELPAVFATASAETFAMGGVSMLSALGFVDEICFGSECGNIPFLQLIAETSLSLDAKSHVCVTDNDTNDSSYINRADFSISSGNSIQSLTRQGFSYPQAHAKILSDAIMEWINVKKQPSISPKDLEQLLSSPNNILAIEYLKAIKRLDSPLLPHTITRKGAGYHDKLDANYQRNIQCLSTDETDINKFPSASGIREVYTSSLHSGQQKALDSIDGMIPDLCIEILRKNPEHIMSDTTVLSKMLYYRLRLILLHDKFTDYLDVSEELAKRIIRYLPEYKDFESFAMQLKTKHYTYTRICRCLLHILFDIRLDDINRFLPQLPISARREITKPLSEYSSFKLTPYARLLGFRKEKSSLLRDVTDIKIITKTADATKLLTDETALWLWEKDMFSADIYRQCYVSENIIIHDEYRSGVVIV